MRASTSLILLLSCLCSAPLSGLLACGSAAPRPSGSVEAARHESEHVAFSTRASGNGTRGNALDDTLRKAITQSCATRGLEPDGRLADIAEAIARASKGASKAPSYVRVSAEAHRVGLVEPTPEIWLASAGKGSELLDAIKEAIEEASAPKRLTHCGGAAISDGPRTVVALAFSSRVLSLERDVPARLEVGDTLRLEGELTRGYREPTLAVTAPNGQVSRIPLGQQTKIAHGLALAARGEHAIELLAEGPNGISVVANFPVAVGVPPRVGQAKEEEGPLEQNAEQVERALEQMIARERKALGLTPLVIDTRLERIAKAHSDDMVAHHFIAHTSKRTGEAPDRVAAAGLTASVVLENIGRGYSASEIHRGLMESPGHRANVLHPDARELGIGVTAESEGERLAFVATELFAKLARTVSTADAPKLIVEAIAEKRKAQRLPSLLVDATLNAAAQSAAERVARDPTLDHNVLLDEATRSVKKPPRGLRKLGAALLIATDIDQVVSGQRLLEQQLKWLGVGVARSASTPNGPLIVVFLLGSPETPP
jgi:uncharacterized protein YkwD